jgi:FixJ family two-component response regulator
MSAQRESIVVVAGDITLAKAIERLLNAGGFHTQIYRCVEDFLQSELAASAGCLILDVHLPDLPSVQLRKHLFEKGIVAPYILISAHDDPEWRAAAIPAGAVAYLTIPFRGAVLRAAIDRALWFGPNRGPDIPLPAGADSLSLCAAD